MKKNCCAKDVLKVMKMSFMKYFYEWCSIFKYVCLIKVIFSLLCYERHSFYGMRSKFIYIFLIFIQVLFWVQCFFMIVYSIGNYPFSFKLRPDYPFNHWKGRTCSGQGIHHSQASHKENAGYLALLAGVFLYIFSLQYFKIKTLRFFLTSTNGIKFKDNLGEIFSVLKKHNKPLSC